MRSTLHAAFMTALILLAFLALPASSKAEQILKILEPVSMQVIPSSNVTISVQFGFDMQSDPRIFRAWLNGKPVGGLFEFADTYVAAAQLSPRDGLNVSEKGTRMNVFAAEVEGPDGSKHHEMVRFTVDCSGNRAPVAQIGATDGHVFEHEFVQLDGSGSSDVDSDPLAYTWTFTTMPKKSKAAFSDPSAAMPNFIPDVPGTYVVQLVADDYKAASEPKTVTIEAVELKILVDRLVDDRIFEILGNHGMVTQSDALEDIRTHHVAILDGKGLAADEIKNSRLLKDALHEGKWGLVLNVTDEQKKTGLIPHMGIATQGDARALLFRLLRDGNTPVVRILELPSIDPSAIKSDPEIFVRYAGMLLKKLRETLEGTGEVVGAAPPPDNSIPPDLINVRWDYNSALPFSFDHSGRHPATSGRTQHGTLYANHTFTLFLDNGNKPTGNKQYLLLQVDINSNPRNAGTPWLATDTDRSKHNEYAWFQDYITVGAYPVEADPNNPKWFWSSNDPTSPNNLTTYSANASFNVGFNQAQGILGSFSCGFSQSYTLADWGVLCQECAGSTVKWKFHSTNPPEHDGSYFGYWDMYDWYYGLGKPKQPNSISEGQGIFHGAVVWNTGNAVLTQPAAINSRVEIDLVDNWCEKDLGTTCCSKVHTAKSLWSKDLAFTIDVAAVIPVNIQSITFDPNPVSVNVGAAPVTIKGYVNLDQAAKIDTKITDIKAESLNYNAFPRIDSITIPKGSRSGSFDIDVNTNGLSANQSVTVGISAFYTHRYTYSLTINAR